MPLSPTALRRTRRSLAAALAALLLPAGALVTLHPTAASADTTVTGIDIASWQHPNGAAINWRQVRGAGHRFAIIKATEGVKYTNPWYAGDTSGARGVGIVVGSYHFARPALPLSTANAQARRFAQVIGNQQLNRTLPPILDIESTGGLTDRQLAQWVHRFLATTRTATGRTPMIYSYDSFLRRKIERVEQFSGYPLWLAKYTKETPTELPGNWAGWRLWQHTSSGKVPGIKGRIDLNHFNGSYAALLSFATGRVRAGTAQARVQRYEPTHIIGRVDRDFAGEWILRQKRTAKGWTTVSKQRVSSTGRFSFPVSITSAGTHDYRIALQAHSPYARITSNTVAVSVVKPWVRTTFSDPTVKRGVVTRLRGTVDSFYIGQLVYRQQRTAQGWRTMAVAQVSATGRYSFRVTSAAKGDHEYRVVLRSVAPDALAVSRTIKLQVR